MSQHIHILGICGTFMGGLALLARQQGLRVSGSDADVYPPMSTQLQAAGIELQEGYLPDHLQPAPDLVVVGNALSRGNPAVEYMLNRGLRYTSGPQWLADNILRDKWVLAVAGTHGKTTTSSLLAWILEQAGMAPGFLIGGVPADFNVSARPGESDFFVVEADEYDTAFFDKRSKFVHYSPRTLCLNNLEYDHADIFPDLEAIKTQFHHLLRTVPGDGLVIHRARDSELNDVLERGCWSHTASFGVEPGADWFLRDVSRDGTCFELRSPGGEQVRVDWQHAGRHNLENALAASAAAHHVGVPLRVIAEGLISFAGVKRRMELLAEANGVTLYDDFAHHPTAIATTLQALRARVGGERIVVLIEPRSNSMRGGEHRHALPAAIAPADKVYWYQPAEMNWNLQDVVDASDVAAELCTTTRDMVKRVVEDSRAGDHVVIMSNGGFGGIHAILVNELSNR